MFKSSQLYDQNTFYDALERDLKCCKEELIIESPIYHYKAHERLVAYFNELTET